ncbi:MAG: glycoside hydrolase family 27 protein [Opitutales bacterium]|nr:glycoside hydrolase family 27 protein [Opitutales bacterium]
MSLTPSASLASRSGADNLEFLSWAQTPPMGWNSWDCFATTVTEAQARFAADYMAENLKAHGWEYVVVDIQWYEPGAVDFGYNADVELAMDGFGRLQPAPNRFPSSEGGAGFKALADYVHGKGLKFGVHLMRGIPRKAVEKNLPIFGTPYHAQDIADLDRPCAWNPDMWGVDMSKPGAQAYYDSVFALLAEWGVDYVKVDDIARPYHDNEPEIEAVRKAIDKTGRAIVLSLSPGETALSGAEHVRRHANLWRISDDFWDSYGALYDQFARLENWNEFRTSGAWPDADMLPLGVLALGSRKSNFTSDEAVSLMTLWSIARSPLMLGADMSKMDAETLALLTNDGVIRVNQHSVDNRPLVCEAPWRAWVAKDPATGAVYLAVFNAPEPTAEEKEAAKQYGANVKIDPKAEKIAPKLFSMSLDALGLSGAVQAADVWTGESVDLSKGEISLSVNHHGARLVRIESR